MALPTISLGTLLKRIVQAVLAVQGATLLALVIVDYRRKKLRKPATFPRLPPRSVTAGSSEVTVYTYGEDLYRDMLNAIGQAKSRIFFESFIWKGDAIGQAFKDALIDAANRGVKVYVVFDEFANLVVPRPFFVLPKNIAVRRHPLIASGFRFPRNTGRDHRKLLVVDGQIGFTGGVGIADQWTGQAQDQEHWRDSHYRLEGPAVAQMQAAFLDNWIKTTGKVLQGPEFFPKLEPAGDVLAQVFTSSPSGGGDSMQLMYLLSVTAAQKRIDLSAAYFVPDELTRRALRQALARGVKVRILVPGANTDVEVARRASRAAWGELLQAGAQIYEYQPAMFHCKMMLVDSRLASVGSTNFDNRSFRLNDEANLNVYDAAFVSEQEAVFEADLRKSKRISYEQWKNRPRLEQVMENVSSFLSSQL